MTRAPVDNSGINPPDRARQLLQLTEALCRELRPNLAPGSLSLDSQLERDLGLDSLSRAELFARVERHFRVSLPPQAFADVETVRDLLRALAQTGGPLAETTTAEAVIAPGASAADIPLSVATLTEVLAWHAEQHPDRLHIRFYSDDSAGETLSYGELWREAQGVAAGLLQLGLLPQQSVSLMLPTGRDYFVIFFAILLCGAIPVPIYPPFQRSQLEDHLRRQARILDNCQAKLLIAPEEAGQLGQLLRALVPGLDRILTPSALRQIAADAMAHRQIHAVAQPSDIALLQYTSGSTGNPKGVILTHANLLANIRAIGQAIDASSRDVFVSWLPLYHDMGLIGAWLGSLYHAIPLISLAPQAFLGQPRRWLRAIDRYGGTLSAAPNFAYELCLSRVPDELLAQLDLSRWRLAFNGAEAVSPRTLRSFCERFARCGFQRTAMTPVYGLAENSVGLAIPEPGLGPRIDRIDRDLLLRDGRAEPTTEDPAALEFPCCGPALPGHRIRIVDEAGRELPDRRQGRLQFRGPSATSGYFRNADATATLFRDDWLESGDLAYLVDGGVYVTGRIKDLIIRSGRNLYPEPMESAVGAIPGLRKGRVAVFGLTDADSGTEKLIVMAETRTTDESERQRLQRAAMNAIREQIGEPPDAVVLASPGTVLKTSSGKIRRAACRDLYLSGDYGRKAGWRQILRLAQASLRPWLQRQRQTLQNHLFAGWALALFVLLAPLAWLVALSLPSVDSRWRGLQALARLWARLTATRFEIEGQANIAADGVYVYVANHASYLDVFALMAALPRPVSFVAKQELQRSRAIRMLLDRLQTHYVNRTDPEQSLADARLGVEAVRGGHSLLFFPEGTLQASPGLMPFRMGAFTTAAEAGVPVLPVAIRGTRSILRGERWYGYRGRISLVIGEPVLPSADGEKDRWRAALDMRDAARAHILRHCREPDLGGR